MKHTWKKLLAWALMPALLGAGARAAELALPAGLKIIGEEAFLQADSLDRVIVPEGTERIDARAFAGSSVAEIELPASLQYIAADAFEDCGNLTVTVVEDSYAHRWAAFSDVDYRVISNGEAPSPHPEDSFAVFGAELADEKACAVVSVSTGAACWLQVDILDEESEAVLQRHTAEADANLQNTCLTVVLDALPATFILEAVLVDADGNALCRPFRNLRYTAAYARHQAQTPADYPAERVVDFGEAGYAVLAEGVQRIPGEAVAAGANRYTFAPARSAALLPAAGEVLLLNLGGAQKAVKVEAAVANADGTITVEAGGDLYLSDVYDCLDVHAYARGKDGDLAAGTVFAYDETFRFADGALTVDLECNMSIAVTFQYDKQCFGEDYFLFDVEARSWGSGLATVTGSLNTDDLKEPIDLEIFDSIVMIPGLNIPANLKVSLPINANVDGEGSFDVRFDKTAGFSWDSANGLVKKDIPSVNSADARLKVDFSADIGPEISLGMDLMGFFEANISGRVGVEVTGKLEGRKHMGAPEQSDEESIHACDLCLDVDVNLFGTVQASVKYRITEKISDTLLDKEILNLKGKVDDGHYSIENEAESIYGGVATLGEGECPNYKYLVQVTAQDMYGAAVQGLTVDIAPQKEGAGAQLVSPGKCHLYDGNYVASARFESGAAQAPFSVLGGPAAVVVQEPGMSLSGCVTNYATQAPVSGATVILTLPDGSTRTATTGSDGMYKFDKLPGGKYDILFVKEGFDDKKVSGIHFAAGTNNRSDAQLNAQLPAIKARLQYPGYSSDFKTAVATAMDGSAIQQQITMQVTARESTGAIRSFTLENAALGDAFVMDCSKYSVLTVQMYAADMGDGAYTYVLVLYSDIDNRCIVLREEGGRLVTALNFLYLGETEAAYGPDGVHDGFVDYNNAQAANCGYGVFRTSGSFAQGDAGYELTILAEEADLTGGTTPIAKVYTIYRLSGGTLNIAAQERKRWN